MGKRGRGAPVQPVSAKWGPYPSLSLSLSHTHTHCHTHASDGRVTHLLNHGEQYVTSAFSWHVMSQLLIHGQPEGQRG